jgi:hypothetical protein
MQYERLENSHAEVAKLVLAGGRVSLGLKIAPRWKKFQISAIVELIIANFSLLFGFGSSEEQINLRKSDKLSR